MEREDGRSVAPPHQPSAEERLTLRERALARFTENTALLTTHAAPLSPQATQRLLLELQVHQIELEMQNDELRLQQAALDAEHARYFDLYDLAPVSYLTVTERGLIKQANLTAATLLGLPRRNLVTQQFASFILKEDQDTYYLHCRQLMDTGTAQSWEMPMSKHDGTRFWAQFDATVAHDDDTGTTMRIVLSDISPRKQAQQQATASQALLLDALEQSQAIQDNMVDGVISINALGLIASFNQAASRIFGYAPAEVLGHNVSLLMTEPQRSAHDGYLRHFHETGEAHILNQAQTVSGQRKDGSVFPLSLSVSQMTRGGQSTFIGVLSDISEQQAHAQAIERLAFYDPLTHLPNRRLLMDRLQQALLNSGRSGLHGALMFLDLDNFKWINDSLGHAVGDLLLQQVALRLHACVREGDSVSRFGGDEFALLLKGLSNQPQEAAAEAQASANKILHALGQPYLLGEHGASSSASIGIVMFLDATQSLDELLKKADIAMYQAKDSGRNALRFFDAAMQALVLAHNAAIADLGRGLAQQELVLHYQIQTSQTGLIIGAEALVRWQHPTRGLVPPGDFIALAEETKLILPLGQWVLETACAQLQAWAAQPETALWTMSVNVSVLQFAHADFVASVGTALHNTGANPCRLKLELTESMLVNDLDDVIAKMNTLHALGVRFELDDFGTGYSSLSYLKRLPIERLKIDQSFVRDVVTDPNSTAIARAIVALGHSLGLQVIAEGVETTSQHELLTQMDCDAFQGYFFGRPVPTAELPGFSDNIRL